MATMQHKIFCLREFIKTESATAVQLAFRLRFNIQPSTRKIICRWNHKFEQICCLCKGKSSGRPRVWVQLFESPCITALSNVISHRIVDLNSYVF